MGIKFTGYGRKLMLDNFNGQRAAHTLSIRLFTDNITPTGAESLGSLTEPSVSGYAPANPEGFGAATDDGTSAQTVGTPCVFIVTVDPGSPINVYGYFIKDETGTDLVALERFADAPRTFTYLGDVIPVVPKINLADQS